MQTIPEHVRRDPRLMGEFRVYLADAIGDVFDQTELKRFIVLEGLERWAGHQPRLMRSFHWGDGDKASQALNLVDRLLEYGNEEAVLRLFQTESIERWFKRRHRDFLKAWQGEPDPILDALSHGLTEQNDVRPVIDLSIYAERIQRSLPYDPSQAIGTTKEMLEATMRTILRRRGEAEREVAGYAFPALTGRCLAELGLSGDGVPANASERAAKKIASSARKMIETVNELRNEEGTGHGRDVDTFEVGDPRDASLIAASGLMLAAWLARHSADDT